MMPNPGGDGCARVACLRFARTITTTIKAIQTCVQAVPVANTRKPLLEKVMLVSSPARVTGAMKNASWTVRLNAKNARREPSKTSEVPAVVCLVRVANLLCRTVRRMKTFASSMMLVNRVNIGSVTPSVDLVIMGNTAIFLMPMNAVLVLSESLPGQLVEVHVLSVLPGHTHCPIDPGVFIVPDLTCSIPMQDNLHCQAVIP